MEFEALAPRSEWIPLFPLPNVVLFPGMALPLYVFEERYKTLMNDILEEGLCFGVQLYREYNAETLMGIPFNVGTVAEVLDYEMMPDGCYNVVTIGRERYEVETYDHHAQPYMMGKVRYLKEKQGGRFPKGLIEETTTYFNEALRMTHKVMRKEFEPLQDFPESPLDLSFLIAENLRGSLILKQDLLETTETKLRLECERDILKKIVKTLAVRTQIEDVFKESPSGGE